MPSITDLFNRQNASAGIKMVSGTAAQSEDSGTYYAVQFVTDCTPTAFTATNCTLVTGVQFPAGTVVYADVLTITCGTSEVYALYKC